MSVKNNLQVDTETNVVNYGKWVIDKDNNISIDCYVTDNERRLLSLRGTARAMGLTGGGSVALIRNLSIYRKSRCFFDVLNY